MRKLLLFIFLCSSLAAQSQTLPPDTIKFRNYPIYNHNAVRDQKGKLHLVFTSNLKSSLNSKEIIYAEQSAGAFRFHFITNDSVENNFPFIAVDNNNIVHVSFLGKDSSGLFQVMYSNNASGSFSKPVFITNNGLNKSAPAIAVTGEYVHFLYYSDSYLPNGIFYTTYNFKKNKKQKEILLADGSADSEVRGSIAADKKGNVHLVFKDADKDGGTLRYFYSEKGLIKEISINLEDKINYPSLYISKSNDVYILYKSVSDNYLYITSRTGNQFTNPIAVTIPNNENVNPIFFTVDANKRFYLVYKSSVPDAISLYLVEGKGEVIEDPIKIADVSSEISDQSVFMDNRKGEFTLMSTEPVKRNGQSGLILIKKVSLKNSAEIKLQSSTLSFPAVRVGETSIKNISIQNSGSSTLIINAISISDPEFSLKPIDSLSIEPDSVYNITIAFNPDDTLAYKATLKIFSNANSAKSEEVILTGKGMGIPYIYSANDSLFVNNPEIQDSILLFNFGTAELRIDSITIPSFIFITETPKYNLYPGDSTFIKFIIHKDNAEFDPAFIDSILIYSNDPYDSTKKIILYGKQPRQYEAEKDPKVENYILHQNYPNPFNPSTTISFTLKNPAYVLLHVYDALAREIEELVDGDLPAGVHNVNFNAENLSTGVYYYKIQVKSQTKDYRDYVDVRKMILVK